MAGSVRPGRCLPVLALVAAASAGCGPAANGVGAHGVAANGFAATRAPATRTPATRPAATAPAPPASPRHPAARSAGRARSAEPTRIPRRSAAASATGRGSARAALATLAVRGRAPMTGYDRDRFGPAWADVDRNGCDTRNDILRRDLSDAVIEAGTHGCVVLTGILHDPYRPGTVSFRRGEDSSLAVQIDHVVALGDAWQTGAAGWSAAEREELADDPLDLLAVDGPANEAKGDADAAGWLPRRSFRCAYVARQIAVKVRYRLWVTAAERAAMARVLERCPQQRLPALTRRPRVPAIGTAPPVGSTPAPATGVPRDVHPGAFCTPQGGHGYTAAGTPMRCTLRTGDIRARWRSG